jgi:predicted Fe-Mo cluster-binding NifX family protein
MRIAVPVKDGAFSEHFGRSDSFDLFVIDQAGRRIAASEHRPLMPGSDCHDFARCVADLGVETVIVGGIGRGAMDKLEQNGIHVVAGAAPDDTGAIVKNYLAGSLQLNPNGCEHEGEAPRGECAQGVN